MYSVLTCESLPTFVNHRTDPDLAPTLMLALVGMACADNLTNYCAPSAATPPPSGQWSHLTLLQQTIQAVQSILTGGPLDNHPITAVLKVTTTTCFMNAMHRSLSYAHTYTHVYAYFFTIYIITICICTCLPPLQSLSGADLQQVAVLVSPLLVETALKHYPHLPHPLCGRLEALANSLWTHFNK